MEGIDADFWLHRAVQEALDGVRAEDSTGPRKLVELDASHAVEMDLLAQAGSAHSRYYAEHPQARVHVETPWGYAAAFDVDACLSHS